MRGVNRDGRTPSRSRGGDSPADGERPEQQGFGVLIMESKKAHIEVIWKAFQTHQAALMQVMRASSPGEWERGLRLARERFKLRLDELGLGQYIDWTEK